MQRRDDQRGYLSLYVRTTFQVRDPREIQHLFLKVAYDDGFVGYLNGREILRENLEGRPLPGTIKELPSQAARSSAASTTPSPSTTPSRSSAREPT